MQYAMLLACLAISANVNAAGFDCAKAKLPVEKLTDVRTLLNSGNVVFSAKSDSAEIHAARISTEVASGIGVAAEVVTVSASDFFYCGFCASIARCCY